MMRALNGEARVSREMIEGAGLIILNLNEFIFYTLKSASTNFYEGYRR